MVILTFIGVGDKEICIGVKTLVISRHKNSHVQYFFNFLSVLHANIFVIDKYLYVLCCIFFIYHCIIIMTKNT